VVEVVVDEVAADALDLAPVYYDTLFPDNSPITRSISRIAPNYHPLIGLTCRYQIEICEFVCIQIVTCNFVCMLTIYICCLFQFFW
jgi:hypothetical protein